jgi:hypothetical protein
MDWFRFEKALAAWAAWYRPRLEQEVEYHPQEEALYVAIGCKTENLGLTERVDALERLAVVAARVAVGRVGGYWTEMHEILKELSDAP